MKRTFWNFQIWPFISQKPLEVYTHIIPHLKDLINCLEGLRHGSTFTLWHALKPYTVLHYKLAKILGNCKWEKADCLMKFVFEKTI